MALATDPFPDIAADADLGAAVQRVAACVAGLPGADAGVVLVAVAAGDYRVAAVEGSAPMAPHEVVRLEGDFLVSGDASARAVLMAGGESLDLPAGARRTIGVPVRLHGTEVGMLVTVLGKRARKEPAGLRAAMTALSSRVAPVVAAGRLEALDTHLVEINSIVEVGQVLTGLLEMEDVLSYVVYLAESLVSGHSASVALLTEDGSELVLHTSTGTLRESEGLRVPVSGSLLGWVVEHGETVITASVSNDPRSHALEAGQGPGVVVPIVDGGRVLGAFLVGRVDGAPGIGPESAAILQKMAAYVAIAITNAEIHRRQQETAEALRGQAEELERAYGDLTRSQEQLLISEKMAALGKLTAGIAHEINSPLGGVLNALKTARRYAEEYRDSAGDVEVTADDHRGIAGDILHAVALAEGAVSKVAQFVKSIKSHTRAGDGEITSFDPANEVDATVALIQHDLRRKRVAVFTEMERGHSLTGDQGKFGVVIQNLISNAVDAYGGEPGEVWVRITAADGTLRVGVADQGSGIPEEIRGRIFDYLFTTKDVGKGTGLGLAMVHSVVTSNFRGEVSLETQTGVGTTFTLTFPLTAR